MVPSDDFSMFTNSQIIITEHNNVTFSLGIPFKAAAYRQISALLLLFACAGRDFRTDFIFPLRLQSSFGNTSEDQDHKLQINTVLFW